jgi:hypothetical protein
MTWNDYIYQPIGHVVRREPVADPRSWLSDVHRCRLMRVFDDEVSNDAPASGTPDAALGAYFRPDAPVSLDLLQVAGLLLRSNRLDRDICARSARRYGGGLYFRWFLAQLDAAVPDPLPEKEFPLHRSRWHKRKAGQRRPHAKQRVHSRNA